MMSNGLLDCMKGTLENALYSDGMNNDVIELKSEVFNLLGGLASEKENCPKIADDLMGNLVQDVIEKGYNGEGKIIVPLLDILCQSNQCIPSFVLKMVLILVLHC